jgi:hypothetical protein
MAQNKTVATSSPLICNTHSHMAQHSTVRCVASWSRTRQLQKLHHLHQYPHHTWQHSTAIFQHSAQPHGIFLFTLGDNFYGKACYMSQHKWQGDCLPPYAAPVVSLCCHACVCKANELPKAVYTEVALPTTPLPACPQPHSETSTCAYVCQTHSHHGHIVPLAAVKQVCCST